MSFRKAGNRLWWAGFGVSVALLALTVILGFIALYSGSPTFGESLKDYIPLFLWAGTAEALRGKGFSLAELESTFTPELDR